MKEIWKDIKGYEGRYQVSNLGNVKRLDRLIYNGHGMQLLKNKILKPYKRHEYLRVKLYNEDGKIEQCVIHRLVAKAFIPNPNEHPMVLHADNNPKNNCLYNLRWGNQSENMKQMWKDNRKTYAKK
jgi:hypothetical protein